MSPRFPIEWIEGENKLSPLDTPESRFEIYTRHLPSPYVLCYKINHGLHSLRKKGTVFQKNTEGILISHKNCHNGKWETTIRNIPLGNKLGLCHIPRGAHYYVNEFGHYVSDQLVFDKLLSYEEVEKLAK